MVFPLLPLFSFFGWAARSLGAVALLLVIEPAGRRADDR
jgi:hypothetical protein